MSPDSPAEFKASSSAELKNYWENLYQERPQFWSGKVNQSLRQSVEQLSPGTALDLGCGEGGDSIWMASIGWKVTGLDVSETAINRATSAAIEAGVHDRTSFYQTELSQWSPKSKYDLVFACFFHSPLEFERTRILQTASTALLPGGHLLIIGHSGTPSWSSGGHNQPKFLSPDQELENLELNQNEWEIVLKEIRQREALAPDGSSGSLDDSILMLRKI